MTEAGKPRKQLRFRVYFWLMDICLICAAIGLADFLLRDYLVSQGLLAQFLPVYIVVGAFTLFFNIVVPPFLMVASFMRDEYAEILWQRSVAVLANIFAIVPLLMFLAAMFITITRTPVGSKEPLAQLFEGVPAGWLFATVWLAYLLLWVGIFQFLRWRDSR